MLPEPAPVMSASCCGGTLVITLTGELDTECTITGGQQPAPLLAITAAGRYARQAKARNAAAARQRADGASMRD